MNRDYYDKDYRAALERGREDIRRRAAAARREAENIFATWVGQARGEQFARLEAAYDEEQIKIALGTLIEKMLRETHEMCEAHDSPQNFQVWIAPYKKAVDDLKQAMEVVRRRGVKPFGLGELEDG